MQSESFGGSWQLRQRGETQIIPAQVPGGVHTDLLAAGLIPDPFVGDNELRVQWVAESDWDYTRSFTPSAAMLQEERVYLVCDGLDTLGR
ncbi:MAG TPA: glycoside hydrolase family 2 protein, partial [Anaerolineaceae bacterium]